MDQDLISHPLYTSLHNLDRVRVFMENHVFSVWTFMCLLKYLMNNLEESSTSYWWTGVKHPSLYRALCEIWIDEAVDTINDGIQSHLDLYLQSMEEIHADRSTILEVLKVVRTDHHFSLENLPILPSTKQFIQKQFHVIDTYSFEDILTYFAYGRELLIPDMFTPLFQYLRAQDIHCPNLLLYLEKHIHLDDIHGKKLLQFVHKNDRVIHEAYTDRLTLWNGIYHSFSDI